MSVTSNVGIKINFAGDVNFGDEYNAESNVASPGANEFKSLSSGNNTIDVPEGSTGVTIIPPEDNEVVLLLKKVNGDTGLSIGPISPSFVALNEVTSFVINADDDVFIRLIWS